MVLTFGSMDEILKLLLVRCVPLILFIMLYKVVPTFECVDVILKSDLSNESY